MSQYFDRSSGRTFRVVTRTNPFGRCTADLVDIASNEVAGTMMYEADGDALELICIEVANHLSRPFAVSNPHPGTGRLLMYLICEIALAQGRQQLKLYALADAIGFYIRLGMHCMPLEHGVPVVGGPFARDGRIDLRWCMVFNKLLQRTRRSHFLSASVPGLLANLSGPVKAQWQFIRPA